MFSRCADGVYNVIKEKSISGKEFPYNHIPVQIGNNDSYSVIGAGSWERVFNNIEDKTSRTAEATNIVKVTATEEGLVEVASVDF